MLSVRSFCDLARPALIEAHVVDYIGRGIPGQPIRVRWGNQEDLFFSGLKIEHGDAYADFQMAPDTDYAIEMNGARDPTASSLSTGDCYTDNRRGLKSYRVHLCRVIVATGSDEYRGYFPLSEHCAGFFTTEDTEVSASKSCKCLPQSTQRIHRGHRVKQ